jgi:hypothetical protein
MVRLTVSGARSHPPCAQMNQPGLSFGSSLPTHVHVRAHTHTPDFLAHSHLLAWTGTSTCLRHLQVSEARSGWLEELLLCYSECLRGRLLSAALERTWLPE